MTFEGINIRTLTLLLPIYTVSVVFFQNVFIITIKLYIMCNTKNEKKWGAWERVCETELGIVIIIIMICTILYYDVMRVIKISMNAPRITVWAGLASAKTNAYIYGNIRPGTRALRRRIVRVLRLYARHSRARSRSLRNRFELFKLFFSFRISTVSGLSLVLVDIVTFIYYNTGITRFRSRWPAI